MNKILFELPPMPYYITIGQTHYEPGQQHPNRRNLGVFDLLFVLQGTLFMGEDEKQWQVRQGQSLLLLPDRYHYTTAVCAEETIFYWIHFEYHGTYREVSDPRASLPIRHAWANPYYLKLPQHSAPRQFASIVRLLELMHEQTTANGATAYWKEQQRFMDLIQLLEEEEQDDSAASSVVKLAERTEAFLRRHYQQDLTNETLAESLHFHSNYIVRCMKETYQCTPMEYLLQYRLEQAKLLLIKTEWPIAKVGEQVGFHYAPYFSSCFKRQIGMTPLSFRKLYAP
ncbi:AraC-like DNA-binding protein [Paenibacillus phyllosphaerae]|uniref:AraC-like DNA-binding protein n=1 Tax=Paenibacillus phyllosphaerae TaxID=274593 RepID=A0A7W5FQ40_9BACL|nr:AraC family transcriptional regulator [Paenibacillus phyllosphaerae]MBB3113081.1 AraC-like DNA-binding protein [Paenibacillus phyllosphaerae]